ncbi:metal-chelation protein CHAD [Burkholderia sp. MSMB0856]|uniref:CYTH and CHAD domain-containing protein n=1 Tax=Burkholderia sp. MSMB0856 TaxID=1637869 RepID=UPI00075A6F93|nr:CYTH and CHAD domain-containing protein [Burkholderia sp. MSMB0856]AOJ90755.1 metal-chelation protein CHAD [Burkholderia sp. MSMB0856]KVH38249.1 metal-chelation protein CHAD [Burkholderia sp. MSMB0856]
MERELKLRISAKDLDKLRRAPLLAQSGRASASQLLTSTYFDTPALGVHRCAASLRVRATGDDRVQTLKLDGAAQAGLFDRNEFETPVDGDVPDLAPLRERIPDDSDCGRLVRDEATAGQLEPVFVTRIRRTVFPLRLPSGDELEVALDKGTVEAESGSVPIAAVELELKRGEPESLYGVALAMLDIVPLRIDRESKADLGYGLLVGEHRAAVKARPVQLKKRDSIEDAFCRIARNCLDQVNANERGVASGHDPSCVHQMRVGLRRLRSALDLFGKAVPAFPGLDDELRWIASELGTARDWEVLAGTTLEQAGANGHPDEVRAARDACEQIAVRNRQRAAAAVESVRYTRLALQLASWLSRRGWQAGMSDEQRAAIGRPARRFATDVLRRRHRKLIERGKGLADLDDRRRHRARIAAKKVRYATEFFASLCSRRTVRPYVDALTALQDDLGWRNDAVVAEQLLKALPRTAPAAAPGAAFARGFLAARVAADRPTMRKLWKRFKRLSPPH